MKSALLDRAGASWRSRICLAAVGLLAAFAPARAAEHRAVGVPGLLAPGSVVVDRWGIAHVFAANPHDAYLLQGWNAARDRLWQIDLWRKRGLGLLSASFGPSYVEQDTAARLFLYRGDMAAEWGSYAPGSKAMTEAFVEGINAYVAAVRAGRQPTPPEFGLTGSTPDFWKAEDVVRIRSHALVGNVASEVARARVVCAGGVAADTLRKMLEPPHVAAIPAGLDPCAVPAGVLKTYELATRAVAFSPASRSVAELVEPGDAREGSNNWVIAPSRTATGRPILANDPHRQLGVPSLRYIVELNAPGLSLIGAGEPALPGVSFGHNDQVAWGLTIFGSDQEDLYVYDLDADGGAYRYGAGWEPLTTVRETIPVKGEAARDVTLRFTRHGPVLAIDPVGHRAFALRTVWREPGAAGYLQSTWLFHARTWDDFLTARAHWGAPPLNLVYADTAGRVGWAAAALTPNRPNWDGLLPVPGDGRYEWKGFFKAGEMPSVRDPAKGWFATANEMNLPPGARPTAYEWGDRSRIDRIDAVLGDNPRQTVADSMALQTDSHSTISRRLIALLPRLRSADLQVQAALDRLEAWDGNETTDSVAATIYEVWTSGPLGRAVVRDLAPAPAARLIGTGSLDAVITALERAGANTHNVVVDHVLLESLTEALNDLSARLGPRMDNWRWGRLHRAEFTPAIAPLASPSVRARMVLGPLPLPGGPSTPKAAGYDPATFDVTHGASVRMVLDVGDWDRSVIVNTPGESADPASPHYGDLFPLWAAGKYVPLLYSRSAVDAAAETVFEATPRRPN